MKTLSLPVFFGLLLLSAAGCDKEHTPPDDRMSQLLLGEWYVTREIRRSVFFGDTLSTSEWKVDGTNITMESGIDFITENQMAYLYYYQSTGWQSGINAEYFLSTDRTKLFVLTEDVKTYHIISLSPDELILITRTPNHPEYAPHSSFDEYERYFKRIP